VSSPIWTHDQIFIILWQLRSCFCGAPSLTRGRVCLLYILLALASTVILESESRGNRDHILHSQIRDFPFRHLIRLAGSRWRYSTPKIDQKSKSSYVPTDDQSASLSCNKAPIWDLRPGFYYCQTVAGLLMWGVLSDERTGLPFTIAADPRQHSHSWVRVPRDSWPYFAVSDSRLPQSGGPGPRIYIPQEQSGPVMSPLNSPSTDRTGNVFSIIACFLDAGKTCPWDCSLATAVVLFTQPGLSETHFWDFPNYLWA
jgi:hypothetical protein